MPHAQVLVILDTHPRGLAYAERSVGGLQVGFPEVQEQFLCIAEIEGQIDTSVNGFQPCQYRPSHY